MIAFDYWIESGRMHSVITADETQIREAPIEEGMARIELDGDEFHGDIDGVFVDTNTGDIRERISVDMAHSIEGLSVTFHALPSGLILRVGGEEMIADGDDTVEFDAPGTYEIQLYPPPQYRDEVLEVTVG